MGEQDIHGLDERSPATNRSAGITAGYRGRHFQYLTLAYSRLPRSNIYNYVFSMPLLQVPDYDFALAVELRQIRLLFDASVNQVGNRSRQARRNFSSKSSRARRFAHQHTGLWSSAFMMSILLIRTERLRYSDPPCPNFVMYSRRCYNMLTLNPYL